MPEKEYLDPDFYETDEAFPIVYLLGLISIDWNMIEQFMTTLIWNYVGGYEVGMAITNNLGNRSKSEMLLELARKKEKKKSILGHIERAVKVFAILKDNRNILMHSHTVLFENGSYHWRRQNPRAPLGSVGTKTTFAELMSLRDTICLFGKYVTKVHIHANPSLNADKTPRMGRLFPLPQRFKNLPHEPTSARKRRR